MILMEGMEVPADGFVIESSELSTDESAMTGETDPVRKASLAKSIAERQFIISQGNKNASGAHDVPSPIIMSGTRILTGEGRMIIMVCGDWSCIGKIEKILAA